MNTTLLRSVAAGMLLFFGASCTTAYDHYGRPRQVVEPGVALLGAAAVGLTALALTNNNDRCDNRRFVRGNQGWGGGHHGWGNQGWGNAGCGYQPRFRPRCY
jgi:hypothetical protein